MKKLAFFFSIFVIGLFSHPTDVKSPDVIDLQHLDLELSRKYSGEDWQGIEAICRPFAGALELIPYFEALQQKFQIQDAVMTGSWDSDTACYLSIQFDNLYTMESDPSSFQRALYDRSSNVRLQFGFSPDMLKQLLPDLKDSPVFFYLGVQKNSPRSLRDELQSIVTTHYNNCIIVIDDCQVPGRQDLSYETSYEAIKFLLGKIYPSYLYCYLIPKTPGAKAKLVIVPRSWVGEDQKIF